MACGGGGGRARGAGELARHVTTWARHRRRCTIRVRGVWAGMCTARRYGQPAWGGPCGRGGAHPSPTRRLVTLRASCGADRSLGRELKLNSPAGRGRLQFPMAKVGVERAMAR